jgi:hypothetical protein
MQLLATAPDALLEQRGNYCRQLGELVPRPFLWLMEQKDNPLQQYAANDIILICY